MMATIDWAFLTRMPKKAILYKDESCFREALDDVYTVFGDQLLGRLHDSALLIIKPDGLATGKASSICSYLSDHGFSIVGVERFRFTRVLVRELWRYQL